MQFLVDIIDFGFTQYLPLVFSQLDDVGLKFIGFIDNFTDNLFQRVFQGYQSGNTTVLIHHNGHMLLSAFKFLQQIVQLFIFGHKIGVTHDTAGICLLR